MTPQVTASAEELAGLNPKQQRLLSNLRQASEELTGQDPGGRDRANPRWPGSVSDLSFA